eukprot:CAMPEP_0172856680 /NCGR_PEP_ID=MMETSP1075-20121228/64172_1 /TAXON_ID=2916 /ORGANISM="Ceratium fusus, Strain PA161109" /LENGTH=866 /DNA_ID=CAMNT_0013703897 /DNA_START=57 /DNA_END=2655 /DNA_ORIENTATION=+
MLVYMPPAGWHHGSPRTSTGCVGATQVLGVMEPLVTKASAEIPVIRSTVRVCDADVVAAGSAQWTTAGSVASTIAPSSESVGSSPRPQDGVWLAGPPSGVRSASDERATGSSEHDHQGGSAEEDWRDGLDGDMAPGSEVQVGNRHFVLQKMIGQGAFGVVWTAFDKVYGADSCLVAMKIMNTSSQEDLDMAIFEAELLRRLRGQLSAISYNRVPQYIAHSTAPHPRGQAGGVVNLAMSFVPGVVLDQWLYGINDEEHKRIDVCQIVSGQLPGSRMHSMTLVGACAFAGELVSQLAGVFAALQPVAFHRDVSSHNVLVNFAESGGLQLTGRECTLRPDFALIDFGLAVRSDTWHHEWSESNLAGDPRYWMSPAWMAFAFGFDHVENHPNPSFHRQYLTRIDHYSLGILGLEVLFALWDVEHRFDEERAPGMIEARKVWCSFWEAMFSLFQMFHMQGPEETRQYLECSAQDGIAHLSDVLKQVQQALRAAEADPANAGRAPLLHVLADLVDEHGVLEWSDIPPMFGVRVEPEPSPTIVEFHHPLMEVHAEPMTGMWSTMQKCDVQQHQAEARRSVGGSGLRMPVQMPQSAAASGTAQASVDTSLCSSGGGLASSKLPEVTRYELLPSNGSCQPRCASLQLLAPFNVRPSRSTSQERGVRLYSQSMSRARSLSQDGAATHTLHYHRQSSLQAPSQHHGLPVRLIHRRPLCRPGLSVKARLFSRGVKDKVLLLCQGPRDRVPSLNQGQECDRALCAHRGVKDKALSSCRGVKDKALLSCRGEKGRQGQVPLSRLRWQALQCAVDPHASCPTFPRQSHPPTCLRLWPPGLPWRARRFSPLCQGNRAPVAAPPLVVTEEWRRSCQHAQIRIN